MAGDGGEGLNDGGGAVEPFNRETGQKQGQTAHIGTVKFQLSLDRLFLLCAVRKLDSDWVMDPFRTGLSGKSRVIDHPDDIIIVFFRKAKVDIEQIDLSME